MDDPISQIQLNGVAGRCNVTVGPWPVTSL
jgi:hypothetical protein